MSLSLRFALTPATRRMGGAMLASALPKSAGAGFRCWDVQNADPKAQKNVACGEAFTVTQVSGYSILIDQMIKKLENGAKKSLQTNPNKMLETALRTITGNRAAVLVGLSFTSNCLAE